LKSKDWAAKLEQCADGDAINEVLKAYVDETEKLIVERTRYSKPETRGAALEGAYREQNQKWLSVISKVKSVNLPEFDALLDNFKKDILEQKQKFTADQAKAKKGVDAPKQEDVHGRKLARSVSNNPSMEIAPL
jgi:hypothetical protein